VQVLASLLQLPFPNILLCHISEELVTIAATKSTRQAVQFEFNLL